jgi:hypothetical protein
VNSIEDRQDYYRNSDVRARIREFLGAGTDQEPSCEFVAAGDENASPPFAPYSPRALNSLLERGFEICRSLWDRDALIADFDIEYVNFDNPAEAFVDPERVFAITTAGSSLPANSRTNAPRKRTSIKSRRNLFQLIFPSPGGK